MKRVRFEMMTQWQRTVFDERPYADQPVYESHSRLLRNPRIEFRPTRPALAMTTYLAVPAEGRPAWLNPLIQACRDQVL